MYQISTWSTKYCKRTTKKNLEVKIQKKIWFAECHLLTLGKHALCRVPAARHSAKSVPNFFKMFAECLSVRHSAKWYFLLKKDAVRFRV